MVSVLELQTWQSCDGVFLHFELGSPPEDKSWPWLVVMVSKAQHVPLKRSQ